MIALENLIERNSKVDKKKSKDKDKDLHGAFSTASAHATETKTQWTKYPHKTGHGFSAEDANAIHDELSGKKVDRVGSENIKGGADRISNGTLIQTKYYQSARGSVDSAFSNNGNGNYQYEGQVLEVPKDQYSKAVERMQEKIKEGKVPGVSDPDKARELVKEGNMTYLQAKNIAKAGNIDSIKFDIQTQAVVTGISAGLSFVVSFAQSV